MFVFSCIKIHDTRYTIYDIRNPCVSCIKINSLRVKRRAEAEGRAQSHSRRRTCGKSPTRTSSDRSPHSNSPAPNLKSAAAASSTNQSPILRRRRAHRLQESLGCSPASRVKQVSNSADNVAALRKSDASDSINNTRWRRWWRNECSREYELIVSSHPTDSGVQWFVLNRLTEFFLL